MLQKKEATKPKQQQKQTSHRLAEDICNAFMEDNGLRIHSTSQ